MLNIFLQFFNILGIKRGGTLRAYNRRHFFRIVRVFCDPISVFRQMLRRFCIFLLFPLDGIAHQLIIHRGTNKPKRGGTESTDEIRTRPLCFFQLLFSYSRETKLASENKCEYIIPTRVYWKGISVKKGLEGLRRIIRKTNSSIFPDS